MSAPSAPDGSRGIEELLQEARSRIHRYGALEAARAFAAGAVLVDIRPEAQRRAAGVVPGALVVERNVLEWRFDPRSETRIEHVAHFDTEVIVMCQEGYTSSLAADALRTLGLHRAGDLDGGFAAWRAAGLPTIAGP